MRNRFEVNDQESAESTDTGPGVRFMFDHSVVYRKTG